MWRKVKVDDLCRRAIAGNLDTIDLKGAIGKVIEVKVGEGDVIGNKEGYSSTRSVLTILPEKVIAREGFRIGFAGEFGFLEAGDGDVMGRNKVVEFILGGKEAITIELKDKRFTRRFSGGRGGWRRGRG